MKNRMLSASSKTILAICAVALMLFAGCEPQKNQPVSLIGTQEAPAWQTISDYDYASSMTAVVRADLTKSYPEQATKEGWELANGDLLAAFSGDLCLGIDTMKADHNGLFFLYISHPNGDASVGAITLRYYSSKLKNLFEAKDVFTFKTDGQEGDVSSPLTPNFLLPASK